MCFKGLAFPVYMLVNYSHEDLESSAEDYMSDLRCGDPDNPEFMSLVNNIQIPISLSTVGFVPLYGGDQTHKVLALFAPEDSLSAVALFLADQWWAIDDIVRTSVPSREGLQQVKSLGERVVLYILNRIIYRKQEIERHEVPFLCHSSNEYAKILWEKGEAIGFYSVKPTGRICSAYLTQSYQLPVLDTMFVRKKHRGKDFGLMMLEDFVDSFTEDTLGLRYPLSSFMHTACKQYFEKYPGDHDLLWVVEGAGHWFQRTPITSTLQRETLQATGGKRAMTVEWGKTFFYKNEFLLHRLEPVAPTSEISEELFDETEGNVVENEEPPLTENEEQLVWEAPEKQHDKEETELEPFNGELEEDSIKASLVAEEETAGEVLDGESKPQSDSLEEESLTLLVPLILDASAKFSEETALDKGMNIVADSEMATEETVQRKKPPVESADTVTSLPREEPSDNGLSNSVVTEAPEDSVSENVSPNTTSSLEEQSEEVRPDSPEAHVLGQSSLIVVELEDVSFQQHPEGQKNQSEEQSEESTEQMDQDAQMAADRTAESSSEEAEIEVPIVDRRTLRRKAKGYKGPPKKKGKPV
uniref:Family with sequence similarity 169 member A n=1 Tax=Sphenodon punctatus TaxID=8508 RepID=A0A8D0G4N2_SPHPU